MKVVCACPVCDTAVRFETPAASTWQCPACDHLGQVQGSTAGNSFDRCAACGNHELYKKKDFPHSFGLGLLTVACLASIIPYWLYRPVWTWVILIGTALIDGILYLVVGDVVVCYRCNAHHRRFSPQADCKPFELTIQERYRQERIRRELAGAAKSSPAPPV